jgi:hypothetical protein
MSEHGHAHQEQAEFNALHDELLAIMTEPLDGNDPDLGMKYRLSSNYLTNKTLSELRELKRDPSAILPGK